MSHSPCGSYAQDGEHTQPESMRTPKVSVLKPGWVVLKLPHTLTLNPIQSTESERSVVVWYVAGLGTFPHFWELRGSQRIRKHKMVTGNCPLPV